MYEELYEQSKNELQAIAWRYRGLCERDNAVSVEDLAQAAFIGLVRAKQSFDESACRSWSLHKRRHITAEIYSTLAVKRGGEDSPVLMSLDAPLSPDESDGTTLVDVLPDDSLPEIDETLLRDEIHRNLLSAIDRLPDPRQRQALTLCGIEGHSLKEAAGIIGVSASHAMQIYNRAMTNLARDNRLMALADLDDRTRFYSHKGVQTVLRDRTSVTEEAALWRIEQREKQARGSVRQ